MSVVVVLVMVMSVLMRMIVVMLLSVVMMVVIMFMMIVFVVVMIVGMIMTVLVFVRVAVFLMTVMVVMRSVHIELGSRNVRLGLLRHVDVVFTGNPQLFEFVFQCMGVHTQIDHGTQKHVAADTAEDVEIQSFHEMNPKRVVTDTPKRQAH